MKNIIKNIGFAIKNFLFPKKVQKIKYPSEEEYKVLLNQEISFKEQEKDKFLKEIVEKTFPTMLEETRKYFSSNKSSFNNATVFTIDSSLPLTVREERELYHLLIEKATKEGYGHLVYVIDDPILPRIIFKNPLANN